MKRVSLEPGQFVFGRKKAATELGMSESAVYYPMKVLEGLGNINMLPNTSYSIISVVNWDTYQRENLPSQQVEQQVHNRFTTQTRMERMERRIFQGGAMNRPVPPS